MILFIAKFDGSFVVKTEKRKRESFVYFTKLRESWIHTLTNLPYDTKPLSANLTRWSNTLKLFVGNLPTNCLSVFDHFVGLALKGLKC